MKGRQLLLFLVFFSVAIPAAAPEPGQTAPACVGDRGGDPHGPIRIQSDVGLAVPDAVASNGVRSGSGTEQDPYVISDWSVRADGIAGIWIEGVSAHVRIENVTLWAGENGMAAPAIQITESSNIVMSDISVLGPFLGAVDLYAVVSSRLTRFEASPDGDGRAPAAGLLLGGAEILAQDLAFCGVPQAVGHRNGAASELANALVVEGVVIQGPSNVAFPETAFLTVMGLEGSVKMAVGLEPRGALKVDSSRLESLYVSGGPEGSAQVSNSLFECASCTSGGALHVNAAAGDVRLERNQFVGYARNVVYVGGNSVSIQQNSLRHNGAQSEGFMDESQFVIWAACPAACGAFRFDANEIIRDRDDKHGNGLLFFGDGAVLRGTGNYFGGMGPVETTRDHVAVAAPRIAVKGPVDFSDHSKQPLFWVPDEGQTAPASAFGTLPVVLAVLLLIGMARARPLCRHGSAGDGAR